MLESTIKIKTHSYKNVGTWKIKAMDIHIALKELAKNIQDGNYYAFTHDMKFDISINGGELVNYVRTA